MGWWRARRPKTAESDLRAEVEDLVGRLADDHQAAGMSGPEARRQARLAVGGVDQTVERCRDLDAERWGAGALRASAASLRGLARVPGLSTAVVVTLALGVGAVAVAIGLLDATLLRPLPYPAADRLLTLVTAATRSNSTQTGEVFAYVRHRSPAFERVAAIGSVTGWNLVSSGQATFARALSVSADYFAVVGVPLRHGRPFTPAEDEPGGPAAIVLSDAAARERFGGSGAAVGRVVLLGGRPTTVVGVAPPGFQSIPDADVWTPLQQRSDDAGLNTTVIGRLRSDAGVGQASAELEVLRPAMIRDLPRSDRAFPGRVQTLIWVPYKEVVTAEQRPLVQGLAVASALVLLLAWSNIAALQSVRVSARSREIATRLALGASLTRATRPVWLESLWLAVAGAGLAAVGAVVALNYLRPLLAEPGANRITATLDGRVVAAALGCALVVCLSSALGPVMAIGRLRWAALRKADGPVASTRVIRASRRGLVFAQVAAATTLLVGAALAIRFVERLDAAELGFTADNVITAQMSLQGPEGSDPVRVRQLYRRTLARLRDIPGVTAAAVATQVPIERGLNVVVEPLGLARERRSVDWRYVSDDYLDALGIPVVAGRWFAAGGAEGARVAIVNAAFAKEFYGDARAAIGQPVRLMDGFGDVPREIVGVLGDVRAASGAGRYRGHPLAAAAAPTIFVPIEQVPRRLLEGAHQFFPVRWVVRATANDPGVRRAVDEAVRAETSGMVLRRWETMHELVGAAKRWPRTIGVVLSTLAIGALLLAGVGLYGMVAYAMWLRTREIGVRRALGGSATRIASQLVVGHALTATSAAAAGLGAAAGLALALSRVFIDVQPPSLALAVAVMLAVLVASVFACGVPCLRAIRLNPVAALREE